ncbi:hypothetical protein MK407_05795 [Streptococcus sanguinis]|uniref:hypothetical protein n=1 Tax=Streptococcus sanguinis TaxID=1305 RepID=UPI0022836A7A|nr:hypothetical protein [Streptococcus sanguinis]MCY7018514.1 hypothetical protein [Streptococcus sanguinis]MCY7038722.1 hypothetical protein [Streptococcus sanguinis]
MRDICTPKFLQELFGRKTSLITIAITMTFSILVTGLLWRLSLPDQNWPLWQIITFCLLSVDISGGVIANLSQGTNHYYQESVKRRCIFLLIHIQPLLLALLFNQSLLTCTMVWLGAMIGALFVSELLKDCREQALTGASMAGLGCILLISYSKLPISMTALLSLYLIKLLFAFSVNHYTTAWSKDYQ